ncbi:hypothetical protein E4P41_21625, partial [Geodermatophilus sp. DF01-2]|uniref:hypothetical protein n=1 Tax=Geodermatophilus sp. DF01-2 TaxID=2559610 RepID=UPI0011034726
MTAPLAPAAPAAAPPAGSPAATGSPDGGERFASALDDAVTGGQGGPREQGRAAEAEVPSSPSDPGTDAPAGDRPTADPAVSPGGMPPALWALLTGIEI